MVAINEAVDKPDSADLLLALKSKAVSLRSITPECADGYHSELKDEKIKKDDVGSFSIFIKFFIFQYFMKSLNIESVLTMLMENYLSWKNVFDWKCSSYR